jgi:hypothetical protein
MNLQTIRLKGEGKGLSKGKAALWNVKGTSGAQLRIMTVWTKKMAENIRGVERRRHGEMKT